MAKKPKKASSFNHRLRIYFLSVVGITIFSVGACFFFLHGGDTDGSNASSDVHEGDLDEAIKPFDSGKFPLEPLYGSRSKWGSFNSGHYFGMKQLSPSSVETSLIWFTNKLNREGSLSMRHLCDQNDNLKSYAWEKHDFHNFGVQTIEDGGYRLNTNFVIGDGNQWTAKIKVDALRDKLKPISLIQYLTNNDVDDTLIVKSRTNMDQRSNDAGGFIIEGKSRSTGDFQMTIRVESNHENLLYDSYMSGYVDKSRYPISSYLHDKMVAPLVNGTRLFVLPGRLKSRRENNEESRPPNLVAYQIVARGSTTLLIEFTAKGQQPIHDHDSLLAEKSNNYDVEFQKKFKLDGVSLRGNLTREFLDKLANVALSNMIGSVGYFYGHSYISTSYRADKIAQYGPIQLLTGVPSRSFFPRGFLWDEAFHNLLISEWDPELSRTIIQSWFNIINKDGWIPREVILGAESMRRVPHEFIIQRIDNANPPVMFLVLEKLFDEDHLPDTTLRNLYPRLKAWFEWFNVTQAGPQRGTYRWRGRDELSVSMLNPKTLTSGLDDYPRSSHPSPDEYHIDLRCWITSAARAMSKFSKHLQDEDYSRQIDHQVNILSDNKLLDRLHWNREHNMYCDYGHNTQSVDLIWVTKTRPSRDNPNIMESYQALERHSTGHPIFGCVPEFGYVSLFPLMMRLIDSGSDKLGILLDRLRDPDEVWSNFGIRSLSKQSNYYNKHNTEHDKPYWRGPIWMNMNYLILSSLKHYSGIEGPHKTQCKKIFSELKQNLIDNVVKEFARTNYIWENYNDLTGEGQGSHPFTGWSSLILLIMTM